MWGNFTCLIIDAILREKQSSVCFDLLKANVFPRGIFRKSTFFNVLTKSAAAAENFPFCTIGW